jgi:crotonobetainyl-CoA:carnitine CoA-transferase CaiB-like acyl-CoA transferase
MPQKTSQEWLALFEAADIPASNVNSIDDLFRDPHLNAVGFWEEHEHPSEGRMRVARFPGTWSKTQPDIRRLAPNLGEHNAELVGAAAATPPGLG